jgi:transcriptional regulator with XRE-family HTH domain
MPTDPSSLRSRQLLPPASERSPDPISTAWPTARPSSCLDYAEVNPAEQAESYSSLNHAEVNVPNTHSDDPPESGKVKPTGRYDDAAATRAREHLRAYVDELPGKQEAAAKALGVSQPTIAKVLAGTIQPSLKILMGLRVQTGRTIDGLLGLEPPTLEPDTKRVLSELAEIRAMVESRKDK